MSSRQSDPQADFNALARQYWDALSQMAGGPDKAAGELPGIRQGMEWWSRLLPRGNQQLDDAVERMNSQAGTWFGAMQQLGEQLAGKSAGPQEIASRWKEMLSGSGANPVADMFARMSAGDAHSFDAWTRQTGPLLDMLKGEAQKTLGMPAFGLGREHQERAQQLSRAQLQYQERANDYGAQLARAAKLAFERFEAKLAERSEPGRQIDSARALFDLWIDAAEEAWSEVAISPEYRAVYGGYVNAQMKLRAAVQREVEQFAASLGLPTRSEMNGSHRKLAALEREVRSLRRELGGRQRAGSATAGAETIRPARDDAASKAASGKPAAAKPASKSGAKLARKSRSQPAARSAAAKSKRAPAASGASGGSRKKSPSRSRVDASRSQVRAAPVRGGMVLPTVALPQAVAEPTRRKQPAAASGSVKRTGRKR